MLSALLPYIGIAEVGVKVSGSLEMLVIVTFMISTLLSVGMKLRILDSIPIVLSVYVT
jgi:hypothetical protein